MKRDIKLAVKIFIYILLGVLALELGTAVAEFYMPYDTVTIEHHICIVLIVIVISFIYTLILHYIDKDL